MSLTTKSSSSLIIRQAIIDDCPLILHFIKELADYEKLLHEVVADVATLEETLFGDKQHAEVVIAEYLSLGGIVLLLYIIPVISLNMTLIIGAKA